MTTQTAFAAESGHWYKADGTPAYTVLAKSGAERPTTLRDARTLNLYPSVTTIIRLAAAPGLERWKLNQFGLALLTLPPGAYTAQIAGLNDSGGNALIELYELR